VLSFFRLGFSRLLLRTIPVEADNCSGFGVNQHFGSFPDTWLGSQF
jgi:hypothetical protein